MAKKSSKARFITILVIALVIVGGVAAIIIANKREKPVSVVTEKVKRRTITQTISAIGKIQPETEVKISSEASGEIIYLTVKEGDSVRQNQLLVRIKPDLAQTQLEQFRAAADASQTRITVAKAELQRSQNDLKRVSELYEKQFASRDEFEKAQTLFEQAQARYSAALADYQQAQAAYRQASVSASRTTIFAPMSGIVTGLAVEQGEKVVGTAQMQGTEMMRISDLSLMNAWVDVDENDVVLISKGDTARVTVDAFPDKKFTGIVYEIANAPKVNKIGTQDEVVNFQVKIRIVDASPNFRPGMSCSVDIETETRSNVLAVPLQAVTVRTEAKTQTDVSQGGIEKVEDEEERKVVKRPPSVVFVKDGTKAKMVRVETGISDNGYIEIQKGLDEGREIISAPFQAINKELSGGALIKVDTALTSKSGTER